MDQNWDHSAGQPGQVEQTMYFTGCTTYSGQLPSIAPQPAVTVQNFGADPWQAYQLQEKCIRLEDQLRQEKKHNFLKEEELKRLYNVNGMYMVTLASGSAKPVTRFTFQRVRRLRYDTLYGISPLVELTVSGVSEPLRCQEDEFLSDKKLLDKLQAHTHTSIELYASQRKVMALLRSKAAEITEEVFIPAFAGWQKFDGLWDYRLFAGGATCSLDIIPTEPPDRPESPSPTGAQIAASEMQKAFSAILNPTWRGTIFLWLHAGFLCTVLDYFQASIPQVLYICVPGMTVEAYLEKILGSSQGPILSLADAPSNFVDRLLYRKDQVALVRDPVAGGPTIKNCRQLIAAHGSRCVEVSRPRKKSVSFPFHSAPIILGSEDSALGSGAEVLVLRANREDFNLELCNQALQIGDFKPEYWSALAKYIRQDMNRVERCIRNGHSTAMRVADEHELSSVSGTTLGTLLGIRELLEGFYSELSLSLRETIPQSWDSELLLLLEEDSNCPTMLDGLAEMFALAARKMIWAGKIVCYPRGKFWTQEPPYGAVYLDLNTCAFDKTAFEAVCEAAGCKSIAVRRELSERGLLLGDRSNTNSYMARILATNAYGKPKTIYVYAISRELIDVPGEPTLVPTDEGR